MFYHALTVQKQRPREAALQNLPLTVLDVYGMVIADKVNIPSGQALCGHDSPSAENRGRLFFERSTDDGDERTELF